MARKSIPKPWRVDDVTFVEIELARPADTRMRVEFDCWLRVVGAGDSRIALAACLIKTLRAVVFDGERGAWDDDPRLGGGAMEPACARAAGVGCLGPASSSRRRVP